MATEREIPEAFKDFMEEIRGTEGREWIAKLSALIDDLERRWSLRVAAPFPNLSYNYVAPATREDGSPAVLKTGVFHTELIRESEMLLACDGRGICRVLEVDRDRGAFLMDRLLPGEMLSTVKEDERAVAIAAEVIRNLHRPAPEPPHGFPGLHEWTVDMRLHRQRHGGSGPLPTAIFERAEALFRELIPSQGPAVLLHGDLHHFNILSSDGESWLAIDPKGIVGEPEYEIGAFLRNETPKEIGIEELRRFTLRRIDQFAEILGFDRERLRGWCVADAVLSAVWSAEDGGTGWEDAIRLAESVGSSAG